MMGDLIYCFFAVAFSFGPTVFIALLMLCSAREKREKFLLKAVLLPFFYAIFITLSCSVYFTRVFDFPNKLEGIIVYVDSSFKFPILIANFIFAILICWALFKINLKDVLFFSSVGYMMQHIPVRLYSIILSIDVIASGLRGKYYVLPLLYVIFYIAMYVLYIRKIRREKINVSYYNLINFTIVFLFVFLLEEYVSQQSAVMVSRIYMGLFCIIILLLMFNLMEKFNVDKQKSELENFIKIDSKRYEVSCENLRMINIKCHDLKHQISLLKNMTDEEERLEYIERLQKEADFYNNVVSSGNKILDLLFFEKSLICEKNGIKTDYIVDGNALSFMETGDMYSLIGNMLDNAVEYLSDVTDEDKKYVLLKIGKKLGVISIHAENYFSGELKYDKNKEIISSKADNSLHGFGLKSIQYIVEKYGGELVIDANNGSFTVDVIFIDNSAQKSLQ